MYKKKYKLLYLAKYDLKKAAMTELIMIEQLGKN